MSYWQDRIRQEAIGLIDSLSRGEPREEESFEFARRYNAQSLSELCRRIGLAPGDFGRLGLTEEAVCQRADEFVRTGKRLGRLRLWVREMAALCMIPAYLNSAHYREAVERSLRLLRLALDPALIPDTESSRRLTRTITGYLRAGRPSPGLHVVRLIMQSRREIQLVTYHTGVPDGKWADIAMVGHDSARNKAGWFVPLSVVTDEFWREGFHGDVPDCLPEAWDPAEDIGLQHPCMYEIAGHGRRGLLACSVDEDGLSCVRCWTDRLDRHYLRMAASLFCVINRVIKARLDGEVLPTSLK